MIIWNAVNDPETRDWAMCKNSRRLKIITAEFGTRAIGRRTKPLAQPGTLGAVAGQGDHGFRANRQTGEPIEVVRTPDGPYHKHRRQKIGTVAGIRQPYKRRIHCRTICGLLTRLEVVGRERKPAPVVVVRRKHGRRRRGRQDHQRPVDISALSAWAANTQP